MLKMEENSDIYVSYFWGDHYCINVSRSLSLKFRGDVYHYYMLINSKILKVYKDYPNNKVELLEDKYHRLWLHVFYEDLFNDRIEEVFDLVQSGYEADERYAKTGGGPRYMGSPPFFFASENPDFILHEDPMEETPGYAENKKDEIILLNR